MLYVVLFVFTVSGGCQAAATNSSTVKPMLAVLAGAPAVVRGAARRSSSDLVATLRRQLMRDNYDYQAGSDHQRNRLKGEANPHIPRTIDGQAGSNAFSADQRELRQQHEMQHAPDPNYAHKSHYSGDRRDERDPSADPDVVPDGVDPADTHGIDPAAPEPYSNDMRAALGPNYSPDRRDNTPEDRIESYEPTYSDKRRDAEDPGYVVQVAPVSDPRDAGNAGYAADGFDVDDKQEQLDAQSNTQDNPDMHDNSDQEDAGDAPAGDNQETDYTDNKADMQATYDALEVRGMQRPVVTRPNRLKYYQPKRAAPREHNVSKRDLLYYVDDDRLRRHNDVSGDLSLTDADQPGEDTRRRSAHAASAGRHAGRHAGHHAGHHDNSAAGSDHSESQRSNIVTISPSNVTYKLLKVKTRAGRRSGARRLVQEQAPDGVALISLDRAPPPALRLPRSRRQYMHEAPDNRPPLHTH